MGWLFRWLGGGAEPGGNRRAERSADQDAGPAVPPAEADASGVEDEDDDAEPLDPEVVEMPIEDFIDLHPFQPREIRDVVRAYLDVAWERGFAEVRIVHGRGIGQQRQAVRKILERDPRVAWFGDAGPDRGGWGATLARFAERAPSDEPKR